MSLEAEKCLKDLKFRFSIQIIKILYCRKRKPVMTRRCYIYCANLAGPRHATPPQNNNKFHYFLKLAECRRRCWCWLLTWALSDLRRLTSKRWTTAWKPTFRRSTSWTSPSTRWRTTAARGRTFTTIYINV